MERYVVKEGKQLKTGYTTGACAAAAAKAAAWMLLTGQKKERIALHAPGGAKLSLAVEEAKAGVDYASCAVRKDSGDDPDVTDRALIWAKVTCTDASGIQIDGGTGVGRVTRQGLDQPVGRAAINSVPRRMIREALEEVAALAGYRRGLSVVISVPGGEELAKKTFNPRLGVVGGISILGTTGIVEPMSERALVDTIRVELRQRYAEGKRTALLTPGNYGEDFIRSRLALAPGTAVQTSNFIGDALDLCGELGFHGALLVGHVGKLIKLAGGMFQTHSRYGDCRMEILAAYAGAAGLPSGRVEQVLRCVSCDDGIRLIREYSEEIWRTALSGIIRRIDSHLKYRTGEGFTAGVMVFSQKYGALGESENAARLLGQIAEG